MFHFTDCGQEDVRQREQFQVTSHMYKLQRSIQLTEQEMAKHPHRQYLKPRILSMKAELTQLAQR